MAEPQRDRFGQLTALECGQPDRVPVFDWIDERVLWSMAELLGWDVRPPQRADEAARHGEESDQVLDIYCRLVEALEIDGTWSSYSTGLVPRSADWGVDKYGRGFMLSEHGVPAIMDSEVRTLEDALAYDMVSRLDESDFRMLKRVVARFGKDKCHVQSINGPFQEGWLLRGGMDKAFLDMARDPDMAHGIGRITTDFNKAVIDISASIGADVMMFDGDLTGNDYMLMSMDHYREFIKPYKKEIVDHAHARGLRVVKHSDGNMWALLDELVDIGFDGFHPVQPQCMEICEAKAFLQGRMCVFGNVDCLDLLVYGAPQEVDAATRACILQGAPGGGHVLCSSNSLHPGVRPENALAMFHAAQKYGDYRDISAQSAVKREDLDLDRLAKTPTRSRTRKRARRRLSA
jgi:uroporphyrinogen decarboxylase